MNRLAHSLKQICEEHLLREKWLLCPSRRVGYQWLDTVTRQGQDVVNARVKTFKSMALDLARIQDPPPGRRLISNLAGTMIMDRILHEGKPDKDSGYLFSLNPSLSLARMLYRSMESLRLADLDPAKLRAMAFPIPGKGEELALLLEKYLEALKHENLVDYGEVLRLARDRMGREGMGRDLAAPGPLLLYPEDLDLSPMEQGLLDAFPEEAKIPLSVDEPGRKEAVSLYQAMGEVNEVREVLRRCLGDGIPLDQVELLHTDGSAYLPLIYESMERFRRDPGLDEFDQKDKDRQGTVKTPPVTFAEGIPLRYARPGRALCAWLSWIEAEFPQQTLVRMVQDGLLKEPDPETGASGPEAGAPHPEEGPPEKQVRAGSTDDPPFYLLARLLKSLAIGFGHDRYMDPLEKEIKNLEKEIVRYEKTITEKPESGQDEADRSPGDHAQLQKQLGTAQRLQGIVGPLLETTPSRNDPPYKIVQSAIHFVEKLARTTNEGDNLASHSLLRALREMEQLLESNGDGKAAEREPILHGDGGGIKQPVWDWLTGLAEDLTILGSGPQPGCLHVANIFTGGHSGRAHTFIVGMDDTRFPGPSLQDPLLLDRERNELSGKYKTRLPTAADQMDRKMVDFQRLLARLRGQVTLSFSCRSLEDDREIFPSPVLLDLYRTATGDEESDPSKMLEKMGAPLSFAPGREASCLDSTEWWLWRMCMAKAVQDPAGVVGSHFPHLKQGWEGAARRRSDKITFFDGFIGKADPSLDPAASREIVLSSNRIETMGRCPLAYFFRYVLHLELPEDLEINTTRWLEPADLGSLLHEVFQKFMEALISNESLPPVFDRDRALLKEIVERAIQKWKTRKPSPNVSAFKQQRAEIEKAALIFLWEEAVFCRESEPLFLEASIGMGRQGAGTALDRIDPVILSLDKGRKIRVRGRIDRVDRVVGEKDSTAGKAKIDSTAGKANRAAGKKEALFTIWDYKTGGSRKYKPADPFRQGRVIQQALYQAMTAACLKESISPEAKIKEVGYFFPGSREQGNRISWPPEALKDWKEVVGRLCSIAATGCFPATNEKTDCSYCDYNRTICGNIEAVVAASKAKLENPENKVLDDFRALRPPKEKKK